MGASELGRMLEVEEKLLLDLDAAMSVRLGTSGVLDRVWQENQTEVRRVLDRIGESVLTPESRSKLREEILAYEKKLVAYVDTLPGESQFDRAAHLARRIARVGRGFFLKKEFAAEILRRRPPEHLLAFLGFATVDEMLKTHDVTEAFAALRFMETDEWMHETFDAAYGNFSAADFEEREIELKVLGSEWHEVAKKFVEKKRHNVSHLKEFGVIFLNPIAEDLPGKFLRDFALLFHYFHEVEFYSKLFRQYSAAPGFPERLKSLLRGDVPEQNSAAAGEWLIVQRYLAKIDPKDPRLFLPRVNPESLHWRRGEKDLEAFAAEVQKEDIGFWEDWAGALFETEGFASLDLEDNAMAAVSFLEGKPQYYTYHQREALWLKIFTAYVGGEARVEELLLRNFDRGIINFN